MCFINKMTTKFYKYLIFTLVIATMSCAKKTQEPFAFVQLCDTQLGMGGYEHDIKTFKQAVKQINQINPDFAVICGDLVNHASDSSYADFKNIMKGFKMPCYLAPGNHDVGNVLTDTSLAYYRNRIGKDYFMFENKGVNFVVTNTQLWKADVANESEKHHQWFKKTMDSLGEKKASIFGIGHYPIFLKTPDEEEAYFNLPVAIRKEILASLKKNKVKAYLSGHKHETLINNFENIQLVSGETTSKNFDKRPLGFRLWEVTSDTIFHKFIKLDKKENQD